MSELKPCHCGKTPEITRNARLGTGFIIECDCGIKLFYSKAGYGFRTENQAADAWNRRSQPVNELLTQADVAKMHFDKVWISYGDNPDDGEWGVIFYGRLYSIDTLEGAGFEDNLVDGFGECGETLNRPTGDYKVYRDHTKSQNENKD